MSTVGLDAELQLDIARALSSIDDVESALNAATSGIPVELDLSGVTAFSDAIEQAVAQVTAAPVDVSVDADTALAEAGIGALSDSPPVDVPVVADTAGAEDALTTLASSAPPVDMLVEADTSGAEQSIGDLGAAADHTADETSNLSEHLGVLGAAAGVAEGSARELVATVGELGGETGKAAAGGIAVLAAATAGFFEEGLHAVSAGQRFDLVLGDMANQIKEIDVNGLNISMEELGIQFGSTAAEMQNSNSKLFQFAINSGASREKAVEFTQQVETLAARAISLNPQLGTLSDVTDTLGPKLARGGRFAAEFGLALTPAEIASRALSDTGKTLTSELTVQEKAMAGAEIASERYGSTLAGTVAEGQKNAAVQAESLKATFKEAIEQIGVPLVSPVLDLIKQAEPDAVLIAEALGDLATSVLPAVSAALTAVEPPLHLIAFLLDQIPSSAIAGVAAFFIFRAALEAVATAAIADEVALTALSTAIPWLAIAAGAVVALTTVLGGSPPFVDELTRAVDSASKGFDDFQTSVTDVIAAELEAASKTGDFAKRLSDANVSTEDLNKALREGGDSYAKYTARILTAAIEQDASLDTVVRLKNELEHLTTSTEDSAKRTLDNAVNTGILTAAERDAAVVKAGLIGDQHNYAAALDIVQPKIKAAADSAAEQAKAEQDAADKAEALQKAMDGLSTSVPVVASALDDVTNKTGGTATSLLTLGTSVDSTTLTTEQLAAIAAQLGVTVDELTSFSKDATAALDDFVSAGLKGLPDLASAIDNVLNPPTKPDKAIIIDPKKLQEEIDADIKKIQDFNANIAFLHAAGLDNLAKISSEKGPEFTQALVNSIESGDNIGETLNAKFGELNQVVLDEPTKLREAGAGIITATGDIARLAAADFKGKFDVVNPTADQLGKARILASDLGIPLADALQIVGAMSAAAFAGKAGFGAAPDLAEAVMLGVGDSIGKGNPTGAANVAAVATATEFVSALALGLLKVDPEVRHVGDLIAGATPFIGAHDLGFGVGEDMGAGIAQGLGHSVGAIIGAAVSNVDAAVSASKGRARITSPSLVMAEIGELMAEGLAVGLRSQAAIVADGAQDVVAQAMASASAAIPTATVAASADLPSTTTVAGSDGASLASVLAQVLGQRSGPFIQAEHVTFGSEQAAQDVEWAARVALAGI